MPSPSGPLSDAVDYARRSREGLVTGLVDAKAGRLHPPAAPEHVRRLLWGVALPVTLFRIGWAHAPTRRSMAERLAPPLLCVAGFTALAAWSGAEDLAGAHKDPRSFVMRLTDHEDDKDDDKDDDEQVHATGRAVVEAARQARENGAGVAGAASAAVAAAHAQAEAARPPRPPAPAPTGSLALARALVGFLTSKFAALYALLSVVEWVLVWIGREHHDLISYEIAGLTGVPGEAPAGPPRLRFNLAWPRTKLWRTIRLLVFISLGSPVAWLVGKVPLVGAPLAVAIGSAWAAYWAAVFAVGNSPLAWNVAPDDPRRPWFVRALAAVGRVPVVGWPFLFYGRLLGRMTRGVWSACLAFEEAPWEAMGLALARAIAGIPVLYVTSRPMFTPAATHVLLARRGWTAAPPD